MTFEALKPGDKFVIDGAFYETKMKGPRIVIAYVLEEIQYITCGRLPEWDTKLARVPDPDDLTGYEFFTDAFSDLRVNRNNATPEELQAEQEAADLW